MWVGGVADSQTWCNPSKPPKSVGVLADLPKNTVFFVGGSPYKSRQKNIAVTCLFVIWTVKLTALIVFRLRAKVSPSWTGRRSAPVSLSPPSPPSTSPTTASPPSRLSTASPPWRGEDYLSILDFFTSMLGWIEFYPCFFSSLWIVNCRLTVEWNQLMQLGSRWFETFLLNI